MNMLFRKVEKPSVYKKFGDVNPMEHGGGFYKETSSGVFEIIHIQPNEEVENTGWWNILEVDTNDSWISKEDICSFANLFAEESDTIDFVLSCINYYGIENFGSYQWDQESAISFREIEKLYKTIESENFIEDNENIKHRIINYFDVWGNQKDGYEVNNMCNEGEITLHIDADNRDVMKALKKFGFLKKNVRMNMIQFDENYIDMWELNDSKGKPVCRVERVFDESNYRHTITYNEGGKRVQKHFEDRTDVYFFLNKLPNNAHDIWTPYRKEEK